MTGINEVNKFTNFLATAQSQNEVDPYDIGLETSLENIGHLHAQDGTVFSNCGCLTGIVSCVC